MSDLKKLERSVEVVKGGQYTSACNISSRFYGKAK